MNNCESSVTNTIGNIDKNLFQICSEVLVKGKNKYWSLKIFEIEQNLRNILRNEISEKINRIFEKSVKILEEYFIENKDEIIKEMNNWVKGNNSIKQIAKYKPSIMNNIGCNIFKQSDNLPKDIQRPNSRNLKRLMGSQTVNNYKSSSICWTSINSINGSYKYQHKDSHDINVPTSLTKKASMTKKRMKKGNIKNKSRMISHNTSISKKNQFWRKNKSLKTTKSIFEKYKKNIGSHWRMEYHNISNMSNSPTFQKFFKRKQPKAQQIQKPKWGRWSSEPVKDQIRSVNNIVQINSSMTHHLESINPTPTVQLNLEHRNGMRDLSNVLSKTMEFEKKNNITILNPDWNREIWKENGLEEGQNLFEGSKEEVKYDVNNKQGGVIDLSGEYQDFSNKFSEISPIPPSDKKEDRGIWGDKIENIPLQNLNFELSEENKYIEENLEGNNLIDKHSILLIDNYEPNVNKQGNELILNHKNQEILQYKDNQPVSTQNYIQSSKEPQNLSWINFEHKNIKKKEEINIIDLELKNQNISCEIKMKYPFNQNLVQNYSDIQKIEDFNQNNIKKILRNPEQRYEEIKGNWIVNKGEDRRSRK